MKGDSELAALVSAVDGDARLEVELGEALGRFRTRHARAMLESQAAELLPRGAGEAAAAQRCHRSTVYRRVSRFQKVARQTHDATKEA